MELKGSKTEKNLQAAFAGESQARNKYTYYASVAKKAGYEQIKAFFEETANNEKEHAKIWFKLLNGGEMPNDINASTKSPSYLKKSLKSKNTTKNATSLSWLTSKNRKSSRNPTRRPGSAATVASS